MTKAFDSGEIVPGERVGRFQQGIPWQELEQELTMPYELEHRSGCFVPKLPSIWFFISEATRRDLGTVARG